MQNRPYSKLKIDGLEALFAKNSSNIRILDELAIELQRRSTVRAKELLANVRKAKASLRNIAVGAMGHGSTRGDGAGADVPKSPSVPTATVIRPAVWSLNQSNKSTRSHSQSHISGLQSSAMSSSTFQAADKSATSPYRIDDTFLKLGEDDQQRLSGLYGGLREKLLDLSRRNPMLSFKLSPRLKRYLQFVNRAPEDIHDRLAYEQASIDIEPLPEPDDLPEDEKTEEFQSALSHAKVSDGHRQVVEEGHTDPDLHPDLGDACDTSHLSPDLEGPSTSTAMLSGVDSGGTAEEIGNLIVGREEALGLPS
jgi:hypothetical protein